LALIAASMAIPELDWLSGGINCAVDSNLLGNKKATSVPNNAPATAARPKSRRPSHSNLKCRMEISGGSPIDGRSPATGSGAVSGSGLMAVGVTVSFPCLVPTRSEL
jgi:hypothetical protein